MHITSCSNTQKKSYQQQVHSLSCSLWVLLYICSWCPRFPSLPLKQNKDHQTSRLFLSVKPAIFYCHLCLPVACWIASMTTRRGKPGIFTSAWRLNRDNPFMTIYFISCLFQLLNEPMFYFKLLLWLTDTVPVEQWCPYLFLLIWSPCLPNNPLFPVQNNNKTHVITKITRQTC